MSKAFGALALALGLSLSAPGGAAATTASPQWVMGYYVAYQRDMLPPAAIDWNGLTHIVMGRIKANADGTLNTDFDWDTTNGPALAKTVAQLAHAAGKKAILMLGGDDNSATIYAAVANHRAAFVANLIATMASYGYDGLDLDWENTIDWSLFQLFVSDLRRAAPNAILTLPTGALNINYQTVDPHIPLIARQLDRLTVMSYSPATAWAGSGWLSWFNSPLSGVKAATPVSIASSLQMYAAAGVAKAKLGMGTSFYAICYTGGVTGPNQSTANGVTIQGVDNNFPLSSLYGLNGVYTETYRYWYAGAYEPYLSLPKPESHGCRYLSYEDEQSLQAKGQFSIAKGYGGIIVWTINQGYVASHSEPNFLMQALYKGFLNPNATPVVGLSILQGNTALKTGASEQFSALVTGTTNKAVTWAVVEPNCGAVSAAGLYKAPAAQQTCTVKATAQADTTKTATANVTVSNTPWTPGVSVARLGTWWVEVTVKDASAASMMIQWADGSSSPLFINYRQYGTNYPVFAANYYFPDGGGIYPFTLRSTSNRVDAVKLTVPACNHGADGVCK